MSSLKSICNYVGFRTKSYRGHLYMKRFQVESSTIYAAKNNNILEQYEKSNKPQSLDFKNPVLEIESNTQDNPRWNSANNQWETTFIARVVEYTVFRHS